MPQSALDAATPVMSRMSEPQPAPSDTGTVRLRLLRLLDDEAAEPLSGEGPVDSALPNSGKRLANRRSTNDDAARLMSRGRRYISQVMIS